MATLKELSLISNTELIGDENLIIEEMAPIEIANKKQLTYATDNKFIDKIKASKALVIITTKELSKYCNNNILISSNPYLAFAKISQFLYKKPQYKIHPNAIIDDEANIGTNTNIGANCYIGKNVKIGKNCYISSGVNIMDNCIIHDNCTISSGVVIGSQGFGFAPDKDKKWHNIYHTGGVIIKNNCSIGANSVIDSGTLVPTTIGIGVIIDNLVHIAHNVNVGDYSAIAGGVLIGGSSKIGNNCQISGGAIIKDHITLTDNVIISGSSFAYNNILTEGKYSGFTVINKHQKWKKIQLLLTKFDKIIKHLNIKIKDLK